jgi:hypothetical protein
MEIRSLYQEGFRFYHDAALHYEATPGFDIRIDPVSGDAVMYLGMRDYLKGDERTRKTINFSRGAPILLLAPTDESGNVLWDGVRSMSWVPPANATFRSYTQECVADPERISVHYDAATACPNDGTNVRTSMVLSKDTSAVFVIKNSTTGAVRQTSTYNDTNVILNQNEYICSVKATGDKLFSKLQSGAENSIKITIRYDTSYDLSDSQRGIAIFTMSDTIADIIEETITV